MPNKESHLKVARRNQEVIEHLIADGNRYPEWLAVVAFYKALHVVEAVLFATHPAKHGGGHDDRNHILKTTKRFENIYKHYRPLFAASLVARYLEADGRGFRAFEEYLSGEDVINILLKHHLAQLEKSAEKLIGPLTPTTP